MVIAATLGVVKLNTFGKVVGFVGSNPTPAAIHTFICIIEI